MTTVNLNAAYFPAIEFVSALATVVVLLYGGSQVLDGHLAVGILVGFLAALSNFFNPITQLSQLYTTYQAAMAALDKIFELLDEQPDMVEDAQALTLPRLRGALSFEHVSFAYPRRRGEDEGSARVLALDDLSLAIAPGETVALVGATGAGKWTFAKLVARFYDVSSGRVLIDGRDVREVSFASLARSSASSRRRRSCSRGHPREYRVRQARRRRERDRGGRARGRRPRADLGASRRLRNRDRRARRAALRGAAPAVSFARALVADPRILVLDEATSNLDLRSERRVEEGMRRLLAGRTAIVIAHRPRRSAAPAGSSCSSMGRSPSRARTRS